jgi:F0F1-type ATP synthase membrane subunit b/b'
MRRLTIWVVLLGALATAPVWAQRPEDASERGAEGAAAVTEGEDGLQLWAWANFVLLAGGLVWVFRKNAVPYFTQRAIGIRQGMMEADKARAAAEERIAAVEARLTKLPADIKALKDAAMAEEKSEHDRMRQETAAELAKIRAHTEREIASAGKAARAELKRYSAALAVGAALDKIRARMNPATQDALVHGFVHNLSGGAR